MRWLKELRAHFEGRRELTPAELLDEFAAGGGEREVLECLRIFDEEYGVPPGLLRASDPIRIFTTEPRSSVIGWLFDRFAYEDRLSELDHHLASLARRGLGDVFPPPETLRDYVRLCLSESG